MKSKRWAPRWRAWSMETKNASASERLMLDTLADDIDDRPCYALDWRSTRLRLGREY